MEEETIAPIHQPSNFILAGNAYFTIQSLKTQARFTFRVSKPKNEDPKKPVRFVALLDGPNNENDYRYLGLLAGSDAWAFRPSRKEGAVSLEAPSLKGFSWFWEHVRKGLPTPNLAVYHAGRCCRCGRKLTTPESVIAGIGPDCEAKGR